MESYCNLKTHLKHEYLISGLSLPSIRPFDASQTVFKKLVHLPEPLIIARLKEEIPVIEVEEQP
jgi:hypothetical protein